MEKPIPKSVLVTAPTERPVSLDEVKNFMRVDHSLDDTLIELLIKAATERVEKYIDQRLITQTWDIFFDRFPNSPAGIEDLEGVVDASKSILSGGSSAISLPLAPVQSVEYFKTYDNDDASYTFPASQYQVDTVDQQAEIALRIGAVYPATVLRPRNGIQIRTVLGWGATADSVPPEIRMAIMMVVNKLYENRGDSAEGENFGFSGFTLPNTAMMLLEPYRRIKMR